VAKVGWVSVKEFITLGLSLKLKMLVSYNGAIEGPFVYVLLSLSDSMSLSLCLNLFVKV
jgi:hypothetical protein